MNDVDPCSSFSCTEMCLSHAGQTDYGPHVRFTANEERSSHRQFQNVFCICRCCTRAADDSAVESVLCSTSMGSTTPVSCSTKQFLWRAFTAVCLRWLFSAGKCTWITWCSASATFRCQHLELIRNSVPQSAVIRGRVVVYLCKSTFSSIVHGWLCSGQVRA
jgi:hypothetical protein